MDRSYTGIPMRNSLSYLLLSALLLSGCFDSCWGSNDDDPPPVEEEEDPTPDPTILGELEELSEGECPDMTQPGMSVFASGGEDRKVGLAFPAEQSEGMPLIIAFHGLNLPGSTPVELWLESLQVAADTYNAVIVSPEGLIYQIGLAGEFLGWGFLGDPERDLTLFDDLRTCMAQGFDIDLNKLSLMGHSGGALWSSILMMRRTNAVASVAEYSGGSDFDIPLLGGPFVSYQDPGREVPALLVSGGSNDVWPGGGVQFIDFESTSDNLQAGMVSDGYQVARCKHELGHTAWPDDTWILGLEWATSHEFGMPSPMTADDMPPACVLAD